MCNTPPIPYSFCTMPLYSTTELFSNSHLGTTPAKYGSCSREISCRGWRNITFIMEVVGIIFTRCGNHQFSNMPDPVAGEEGPWTPVPCRVQECRCDCFLVLLHHLCFSNYLRYLLGIVVR